MNSNLVKLALMALDTHDARKPKKQPTLNVDAPLKKVVSKTLSYTDRHRGQWFKPEYDLDEIQRAQDTDSYFSRSVTKKVNRFMIAAWEFHGVDPETVDYIKRRVAEIELVTNQPWAQLMRDTVYDMFRFSNCMWTKVRDDEASSGDIRVDLNGNEINPVAGYFILPFETLEFQTKPNGEIKKVMQRMPSGKTKEWLPQDVIHFYTNRKPGFAMGTPEVFPALDDIALLRRLEENVEELIETNLFPVYHYTVGTDEFPERITPEGEKESDVVKRTVEYMPAGAVYVSDHRHKVSVMGSESQALRIDFYLTYFKSRVFAGLGISPVDVGEGDTANRSTAGTLSKSLMMDVEAMQQEMKTFIEFYVVKELLLEGGYNPIDDEQKVELKFGVVDKEERTKLENQTLQMVQGKLYTVTEGRAALGKRAYKTEEYDDTYYKLFEEPLAMLKMVSPGSAAGEVLGGVETSNITPEAVAAEKQFAKEQQAKQLAAKKAGNPGTRSSSTGAARSSAAKARPSNQSGTRAGPKLSKDLWGMADQVYNEYCRGGGIDADWSSRYSALTAHYSDGINKFNQLVERRSQESDCSLETVYDNLHYRLEKLDKEILHLAYMTGVESSRGNS